MTCRITPTLLTSIVLLFLSSAASGQADSARTVVLNSVFVTESKPTFNTTSRQVVSMTNSEIRESGAQTLSEALSALPGISQLTTGAISKPVIRGLYGDRVLVHVAGLRLEDQQWEDEYGLGLSEVGIERVELIKGPASLLYGAGALGGVVNIVEEDMEDPVKSRHNLNARLFSNTYGIGLDYGYRNSGKNTFIVRGGIESHADYSDGVGKVVPNTRFALYNLKIGYIVNKSNFTSVNRFITAYNQFGFVSDTSDLKEVEEEGRLSREFEDEHQNVLSTILSSVNSYRPDERTEWRVTVGFQNNWRKEQERAETENLNLVLSTVSMNANLQKLLGRNWTWTNGLGGIFQVNTNLGSRILVPDATIGEGSAFSYLKFRHFSGSLGGNFEAGLRYDHRQIVTHETGSLNPPTSTIPPFRRGFDDVTGSLGESLNYRNLLAKLNLSTGFRAGNLAELAANGLHEGTDFWYLGNPGMKPEKCLSADLSASWKHDWLTLRGSLFNNWFRDFIYLRPTNETIDNYTLYRYEQDDAVLKGFETGFTVEKEGLFTFSADYSYLNAKRDDGSWLPLIPSNRLLADSRYYIRTNSSSWQNLFVSLGLNYTLEQNHIDAYELPTPSYWVLNAGLGVTIHSVRILLTCKNLTNQLYYDHLSRLKYYNLYDMGRNIVLNVGWQF